MKKNNLLSTKQRTINLALPIFFQSLCQSLFGTMDTFMVSQLSDQAVAAIGIANKPIELACKIFYMVSMGIIIIIPQLLGKENKQRANAIAFYGICLSSLLGIFVSLFFIFFSNQIVLIFNVDSEIRTLARLYLLIVGAALIFQSLMIVLTAIMQSYEKANFALHISILSNIINVIIDYIVIYEIRPDIITGTICVAISTSLSQFVAATILLILYIKEIKVKEKYPFIFKDMVVILKTGGPAIGETFSYSLSQFVITLFITELGTIVLTGYLYAMNIMVWISRFPIALGKASGIIVGSLIGEKKYSDCSKYVLKNVYINLLSVLITGLIPLYLSSKLLKIFTLDSNVLKIGQVVIFFEFIALFAKSVNFVLGDAIRGSGNPSVPMVIAIFSMWFFGVGGAYCLGMYFALNIYGIEIAFILDESIRAFLLAIYWTKRKWINKSDYSGTIMIS